MQAGKGGAESKRTPTMTSTRNQHHGFRLADVEDDRAWRAYNRWNKTER